MRMVDDFFLDALANSSQFFLYKQICVHITILLHENTQAAVLPVLQLPELCVSKTSDKGVCNMNDQQLDILKVSQSSAETIRMCIRAYEELGKVASCAINNTFAAADYEHMRRMYKVVQSAVARVVEVSDEI